MIKVNGQYNNAKIFTDVPQDGAIEQIRELCNQSYFADNKIRVMPDYHVGAGCTIGLTSTLENKKVSPNLVGVDIGCLDKDTEFLTQNGWVKISEYLDGDMVLQYNKENDSAEFVAPQKYIKKPCDTFYHFKNEKGLDQMLSEEHKMLVWSGYKSKGYSLNDYHPNDFVDKNLSSGYYGIKTSFDLVQEPIDFLDDEIRLLIMVSADGTIRSEHNMNNKIELHFKKKRKIDRAFEILNNLNVDYEVYYAKDNTVYIDFYYGKKINKSLYVLWGADKRQLEIVTKECLLWDGHSGYRSYYSSTNKENADVIQFAFASNNIRAGISISKPKNKNHNNVYIVTPTKNSVIGISKNPDIINVENEFKYCFTVPSGYFVARRNGKMFITGNCGMLATKFNGTLDFEKLDHVIRTMIPHGSAVGGNNKFAVHDEPVHVAFGFSDDIHMLRCYKDANVDFAYMLQSLGSLGSGNHFIEVNVDEDGGKWLVIHSGSRNLGVVVATHYQNLGWKKLNNNNIAKIINELKDQGRHSEIQGIIENQKKNTTSVPKALAYVEGDDFDNYIHDMDIVQRYAQLNREIMANIIFENMGWEKVSIIETIHNYIDIDNMIMRKGAVSADRGEMLIIPINMRDGSIIAVGKGNDDWNRSAPHGAGRIFSRKKAKEEFDVSRFENEMEGIYTTSISEKTLDESPMAYKDQEYLLRNIRDTVEVTCIIKPVYNFKAEDE